MMEELVNNLRARWIEGYAWEPINLEPKELTPQKIKMYVNRSLYTFSSMRDLKNYPRISALKFRSIIRKAKQAITI